MIISTVDDDHEIRNMVDSSSLISPTPNSNNEDGSILNLQLQETGQHRVERSDNHDPSNGLDKVGRQSKDNMHLIYE